MWYSVAEVYNLGICLSETFQVVSNAADLRNPLQDLQLPVSPWHWDARFSVFSSCHHSGTVFVEQPWDSRWQDSSDASWHVFLPLITLSPTQSKWEFSCSSRIHFISCPILDSHICGLEIDPREVQTTFLNGNQLLGNFSHGFYFCLWPIAFKVVYSASPS